MSTEHEHIDWKTHGVKVIPGDQLDPNTAQTSGMDRAAAINFARVGAQKIWAPVPSRSTRMRRPARTTTGISKA